MAAKNFKAFADKARRSDAYWAEHLKIEFAEELGRLMERRGVTRAQLAERIGSSAAYITKALRGDTNFTIESMVKLVRALGGKLEVRIGMDDDAQSGRSLSTGDNDVEAFGLTQNRVAERD